MILLRRHGLECYDVIVFGVVVLVDLTSTEVQAMVAALCSGPRELQGPGDVLTEAESRAATVRQAVCDGTVRMTSNRHACRCRVSPCAAEASSGGSAAEGLAIKARAARAAAAAVASAEARP